MVCDLDRFVWMLLLSNSYYGYYSFNLSKKDKPAHEKQIIVVLLYHWRQNQWIHVIIETSNKCLFMKTYFYVWGIF